MLANFIRLAYLLLVLYETQVCFGRSSALNSYDLCDVGDAITSLNGSIVANKTGKDCTRLILAPKGWRIRFTLYDVWMGNGDSALYFYDGGTIHGTSHVAYSVKENVHGDEDTIYSTSNALVLHTDKIALQQTRLNATFVMFPHSSKWCSCPPVVQGQTECTLTTALQRSGDSLERHCKTTCDQGYKTLINGSFGYSANRDLQLTCKRNLGKKEATWEATSDVLEFKKLVTCSKANPVTRVTSVFKFDYNNISCEDIDLEYIRRKVSEYIVNGTDNSYTGECFKSKEMAGNPNCTVRRVNVSCSSPNNSSRIQLRVEDNVLMLANLTLAKEIYGKFSTKFGSLLSSLGGYITKYVSVNNRNATNFAGTHQTVVGTCPVNNVFIYINEHSCLSCPMHYEKQSTYMNLYFGCSKCPDGQRRKLSEQRCVVGPQNYPKALCQHRCALGKFFSNDSGICEWCPYGMFQNSTTSVNPVCRSCPGGKSTGFVGAKNEADCIDICRAGQYFKNPGCAKCAIGYFMQNENNRFVKCYQCNSGMTTLNVGTKNETDCIKKCSLGEYFNISQGICAVCPNNAYQDEVKVNNTRNCKSCPANTVTLSAGSRSLSACLGQCAPGQYVDIQVKSCELCPRNTYQDMADHASFSCKLCGKYKITQNVGSMNISACIYSCSQGEFFNNNTSKSCEKCGINTYQDEVGKDFCNSCPGKTFTMKLGSKQCLDPCQFGQFFKKSAEQCQDCPNGYYQNISDYMSENCFPCPLDFYNDKLGRRNCTACPDKTVTVVTGATRLSECLGTCKPGSFLNQSRKSCQECLKGFYQDQKDYRLEHCTKCPSASLTTLEAGASTLVQCVGYCASFPCLNGGECANIDNDFNCTCPKFIKGKRCEMITDEKETDEMEVAIRFPDLVWNQNLSNPQSKEFIELAKDIENNVRQEFKNDKTFRTVKVKEFQQGSVISDLELNYVAGIDFKTPVDTLSSAIADGKLGNLTADNSSINVLNFTCTTPLGMENGRIPDEAITSANKESYHPPSDARLNRNGSGWAPKILHLKDAYLQVDFQEVVLLTSIGIQGSSYKGGSWLHNYYLNYSSDGRNWLESKTKVPYIPKIFEGNTDVDKVVPSQLDYPVRTRYVRIIEHRFKNKLSFRIEFYGCPIPKTVILPTRFPTAAPTGTTATGTAATDSTAQPYSTFKSDDDDDDSNVGLIVGLVLGFFVLILLVAVAVWWMKKKKASHNFGSTANAMQLKSKS